MRRRSKVIIGTVLAAVLLLGSLGGIAIADENEDSSQPGAPLGAMWDKVALILQDDGVDVTLEQLKGAFAEAQGEMLQEAMENHLDKLVEEGVIESSQAEEYLEWWQSKPDVSIGFGLGSRGGFRGMGGMRGFGGPCAPAE